MEEKPQEVKAETSGIVVLDEGVALIDADVRLNCCSFTFLPIR